MSLTITVAAPFRHARKDRLKKNEIIYFLAFDRHWMNIEQANLVLARAGEEGLIEHDGEMIKPLFDLSKVEIPLGFKPTSSVFDRADPVEELVQRIAAESNTPYGQLIAEMNNIAGEQFDGHLLAEAAVVILAKRYRIGFEDLLPPLREQILKK